MTTKLEAIYPEPQIPVHGGDLLNLAADITIPIDHDWRIVTTELIEAVEGVYNNEFIDSDDLWIDCQPQTLSLTNPLQNNLSMIITMATAIARFPTYYLRREQKLALLEAWGNDRNYHILTSVEIADLFADMNLSERQVWAYLADSQAKRS